MAENRFRRLWREDPERMLGYIRKAIETNRPGMSARAKRNWRDNREVHLSNAMQAISKARKVLKASHFAPLRGVSKSGETGCGIQNIHADEYRLIAPDGRFYEGVNIAEFVRTHADLFDASDLIWRKHTCRAQLGLCALRPWLRRAQPANGRVGDGSVARKKKAPTKVPRRTRIKKRAA